MSTAPLTVSDIVIIIGAIGTSLTIVINALGNHWGRRKDIREMGAKLDVIHDATNGGVKLLKDQLQTALEEIVKLREAATKRL